MGIKSQPQISKKPKQVSRYSGVKFVEFVAGFYFNAMSLHFHQLVQHLQNFYFPQRREHHHGFYVPRAVNARDDKSLLVRQVVALQRGFGHQEMRDLGAGNVLGNIPGRSRLRPVLSVREPAHF